MKIFLLIVTLDDEVDVTPFWTKQSAEDYLEELDLSEEDIADYVELVEREVLK